MKQHLPLYAKLSAIVLGCFLFCSSVKAQYVTIPDSNFVAWLDSSGYAGCMNGNQLDTTCPAVLNTDSLTIIGTNINNFTGIQYFKNATYWDCNDNFTLNEPLAVFPPVLQTFICTGMVKLTGLNGMPNTLTYLDCHYTGILFPPDSLPPGLLYFDINSNYPLDHLPPLPLTLTYLNCLNNAITSLPPLPPGLTYLDCSWNKLSTLPQIPATLTYLNCNWNQLTSLPELPDSMYYFNCLANYSLACLPQLKRIVNFNFNGTDVTCLPDYGNITNSSPWLWGLPLCGVLDSTNCPSYWNIAGAVYYDSISNCLYDSGAVGINYAKVQLYSNGILQQQVFTSGGGDYSFQVPNGNYTVQIDTAALPCVLSCPSSGIYNDTISATDSAIAGNNFAFFKCRAGGFDIGVQSIIHGYGSPRPNGTFALNTVAGDMSHLYGANCATGISGAVQLIFNGPITYLSPAIGALTPTTISGDTITWSIADFGVIDIYTSFNSIFQVDSNAVIGNPLCFAMSVTPLTGDFNPSNNTLGYCFDVANSFDPNGKEVYPAQIDSAGEWLTYTIRFQNTGTAVAQNVYIADVLDNNVDPSTFQLLNYSAPNITELLGNKVVRFNFLNINLPDSATSDSASRGFVQYKIRVRNGVQSGTVISNIANIYFDTNPAIVTNTVTDSVDLPCSITQTDTTIALTCGDSAVIGTNIYYNPGTYTDTLLSWQGCDSIITLNLTVNADTVTLFGGLCNGDSVYFYGRWLHTPGEYDTILPGTPCDTFAMISLVVIDPLPPTHIYDTICANDSVAFNGIYLDTAGIYTAHFTGSNGCDSAVVFNLTVIPAPPIPIITVQGHALQSSPGADYRWYYNDTLITGDTSNSISVIQNGNYQVQITGANGCTSISSPYTVSWANLPVAAMVTDSAFNPNFPNVFSCSYGFPAGTEFRLISKSINSDSIVWTLTPLECFWRNQGGYYTCDSLTNCGDTTFTGDSLLVTWSDVYSNCPTFGNGSSISYIIFCITAYNQYGSSSFCDTTCQLFYEGINNVPVPSISIYPNPTSTTLFIKVTGILPETMKLYTITGQVVYEGKFEPEIDVSNLSAGAYFVEVKSGEQEGRKMFVKM